MSNKRTILEVEVIEKVGLRIKHKGERPKGAKGVPSLNNETIYADPSDAFNKAITGLREALTKSTALGSFENALEGSQTAELLQDVEVLKLIKAMLRHVAGGLSVQSVTIKHDEADVIGAKIKGKYVNKQGDTMVISSPLIRFDGENVYGWEQTLKKKILVVIEEALETLGGNYVRIVDEAPVQEPVAKTASKKKDQDFAEEMGILPKTGIGSQMRVATA